MSTRNTWITLVAGLFLAISLGGLSSHWVPTATSAYRVEASSYAKDEQDEVTLFASNDAVDIGALQNTIANTEAELAKIKTSYDSAKQELKWQAEFEELLNAGTTDLAAMLPNSSANTEELEKILNSPAQLKVNLPAIPEDQWKTPKAAESLGEEWVWIGSKENGFWVKKNESVTKPSVVDFAQMVKMAAVSPTKDQWLALLDKKTEVLNLDDASAEYVMDGDVLKVIGRSDFLKAHPQARFDPNVPLTQEDRTKATQGALEMPKKADAPVKPTAPAVTFQEAYAYAGEQLGAGATHLTPAQVKEIWMPRLKKEKQAVIDAKYNQDKKAMDEKYAADLKKAEENQPKEDSFAYRWIILPN